MTSCVLSVPRARICNEERHSAGMKGSDKRKKQGRGCGGPREGTSAMLFVLDHNKNKHCGTP